MNVTIIGRARTPVTTSRLQTEYNPGMNTHEQAGYFEVSGAHLYTVLHGVANPIARVLLVGSFASERHLSYIPWVRWARYLASRGVECLRYDYRGIGESTGAFEEMGFKDWIEDVGLLAAWIKARSPEVPVILHGLELGALLAGKSFDSGIGDGLLLWGAPPNANQALRSTLLYRVNMDNAFKYGDERKPASEYIRMLESSFLEVGGYRWTSRLWRDSFQFELPSGLSDAERAASTYNRPVRIVKSGKLSAPLLKGSSVGYEAINRDFSELFADNFAWIAGFTKPAERHREQID